MKFNVKKFLLLVVLICFISLPVNALTEKQSEWFDLMKNDYLGKGIGIDQDGVYGAQCVDLVNNYVSYMFPFSGSKKDYSRTIGFGSGGELYYNARNDYFEKIPNALGVIPKSGDIAVWGGGGLTGSRGHVAVVYYADNNSMILIHQNGSVRPTVVFQERTDYHKIEEWSGKLIGFLRPRIGKINIHNPEKVDKVYNIELSESNNPVIVLNNKEYKSLVDLKLVSSSDTYKSTDYLTRMHSVILVLRLTGNEDKVKSLKQDDINKNLSNIKDIKEVPNWAKPYLAYAIKNNIVCGVSDTDDGLLFNPNGNISGGSMATIIYRSLGHNVENIEKAKKLYIQMFNSQIGLDDNNLPEELVNSKFNKNSTNINLLSKEQLTRNDAAKIILDVLSCSSFINNEQIKILNIKNQLIQEID